MSFTRLNSFVLSAVRFFMVAVLCAVMVFSNAWPAAAIGTTQSSPSKGEEHLDEIFEKSEDILKGPPADLEKEQAETHPGLNAAQGDADRDKMYRPSNSQDAVTPADQIERALEKVVGRD